MRPRIDLARFLIRLGRFISSLSLMVMRPDDLLEFGRQNYAKDHELKYWGSNEIVNQGLTSLEKEILKKINLTQGNVLILALGGGREAIALAKRGFSISGIDFIPQMVAMAKENAAKHGVYIDAQVGELTCLAPPPASFDLVWLSDRMYSCIPTRRRRVKMLRQMYQALRPGGWFACMFFWLPTPRFSPRVDEIRKLFAYFTLGNLSYERGDILYRENEFIHTFGNEAELHSEFHEAGFELPHPLIIRERELGGFALLHKAT